MYSQRGTSMASRNMGSGVRIMTESAMRTDHGFSVRSNGASAGTAARSSSATIAPKIALPSSLRCVLSGVASAFGGPRVDARSAPTSSSRSMLFACRSTRGTLRSRATVRAASAYPTRSESIRPSGVKRRRVSDVTITGVASAARASST